MVTLLVTAALQW